MIEEKDKSETPVGKYLGAFLDNCLDCKFHYGCPDKYHTIGILNCNKKEPEKKEERFHNEFYDKIVGENNESI